MTKKLMMMVAAVAVAFGAWAETETVGDYTWTCQINGGTAEIRNGYSAAISPSPTGAVTIPSTLGGKTVTSIDDYAFSGCSDEHNELAMLKIEFRDMLSAKADNKKDRRAVLKIPLISCKVCGCVMVETNKGDAK